MRKPFYVLVLAIIASGFAVAQRTDLSGTKICIDPGHGGHSDANDRHLIPDPGTNFYESESNFQTAMLLKSLPESASARIVTSAALLHRSGSIFKASRNLDTRL